MISARQVRVLDVIRAPAPSANPSHDLAGNPGLARQRVNGNATRRSCIESSSKRIDFPTELDGMRPSHPFSPYGNIANQHSHCLYGFSNHPTDDKKHVDGF